jgi:predicted PurR-regulated permease PerM
MKVVNDKREVNWVILGVLLLTVVVWSSVYFFGFFLTIIWTIVISAVLGIIIKLLQQRY